MSNARVMFASGSREMAHNLDDLRERWLLRRQEYNQLAPPNALDNSDIPDYRVHWTIKTAKSKEKQLALDILELQGQLTALDFERRQEYQLNGVSQDKALLFAAVKLKIVAEIAYKREFRTFLQGVSSKNSRRNIKRRRFSNKKIQSAYSDPDKKVGAIADAHGLIKDWIIRYNITPNRVEQRFINELGSFLMGCEDDKAGELQ